MEKSNGHSANGHGTPTAVPLTYKESMVLMKYRQAKKLAETGHRSRLEIMFYDDGKSCDITVEDRERVVERMSDKDM